MLDFSLGELMTIGVVALVVLGPERLPRVARTFGQWLGKAQRYVSQVRVDIQREIELADLKRIQEEARRAAQSIDATVRDAASSLDQAARSASNNAASSGGEPAGDGPPDRPGLWGSHRFRRRSRPGATFGELEEAVEQLRRQLSMPAAGRFGGNRYAPRSRVNRPRIRR
jgi:sec-independent protein translocase protein TatB